MERIFEDRSTYNPAVDPVGVITFRVECNPKQAGSVVDAMRGIITSAGVYAAEYEIQAQPKAATKQTQGASHAEQPIQQSGRAGEKDERDVSKPEARNVAGHDDERSGLAGTPRKGRPRS